MLKLVFLYNQFQNGFTETYYASGDDPYLMVGNITDPNLYAMVKFRSNATGLYGVRASQVGGDKLSALRLVRGDFRGDPVSPTEPSNPDVVSTDGVFKMYGALRHSRRVFLRGLRDDYVARDGFGNDFVPAAMAQGIKKYFAAVTSMGLSIRFLNPPGGGSANQNVVKFARSATSSKWTTITVTGGVVQFPVGTKVVFHKVSKALFPNFPMTTTVIASGAGGASAFDVDYQLLQAGPIDVSGTTVRAASYGYDPISTYVFERWSERKTGRPIGLLRGRSKTVKIAV